MKPRPGGVHIESRDGKAKPHEHGEWLETVVVQGDYGREDERHKGKGREQFGSRLQDGYGTSVFTW